MLTLLISFENYCIRNNIEYHAIVYLLLITSTYWLILLPTSSHWRLFLNLMTAKKKLVDPFLFKIPNRYRIAFLTNVKVLNTRLSKKGKIPSRKVHKLTQYSECNSLKLDEVQCYQKVRQFSAIMYKLLHAFSNRS